MPEIVTYDLKDKVTTSFGKKVQPLIPRRTRLGVELSIMRVMIIKNYFLKLLKELLRELLRSFDKSICFLDTSVKDSHKLR